MTGIILMSGGNNGADVSGVTATAQDVLAPKVIVDAQGNPITGVIPTYSGDNPIVPDSVSHNIRGVYVPNLTISAVPTEAKSATPSTQQQIITPTQGKFLSQVAVAATPTQSKTVTPTTSQQTVTPDSGKFLSSVVVNAAPAQKQIYSTRIYVTPGTSAQQVSIPSGYDAVDNVYVYGDSNLAAGNIKSGVSIFGKTGTYTGASVYTGNIYMTPGTSNKWVSVPSGYSGVSNVCVYGDSYLKAANIKKGVTIFDVTGTYEGQTTYVGTGTNTSVSRSSTTKMVFSISSSYTLVSFGFIAGSKVGTTEVAGGAGRSASNTGRAVMGNAEVGNVLSISWGINSATITITGGTYTFGSGNYTFYYSYAY